MAMESKYGQITAERKDIPKDEPCFLLRGQDILAAKAVRFYADLREKAGDSKAAKLIRQQAQRMSDWPVKKIPD
jgi:hypothetical protein